MVFRETVIPLKSRNIGYSSIYPHTTYYSPPMSSLRRIRHTTKVQERDNMIERHEFFRTASSPDRKIINLVIQRPKTPPPTVKTIHVMDKAPRPRINTQVIRVAPRGNGINKLK
jgi:hypothetical protein